MKTVAFVPLRLNSQRVAGKNLRLLGGEPLMCHILRTLAGIGEIDEVYAYCSDERICEYLPQDVRFLRRSPDLDRDTTLGREIYDSFTADVEADLYVLAHATSPFIRAETVADALRHVRSGEYDSAFSAEKIQTFAWFEGRPLNYALDDIPRTQTIEPVYIETSAFFIFPRTLWCGRGRRIGEKPYMAVVDRIEGLDSDYPEDFAMAEIIAASRNHVINSGENCKVIFEIMNEGNKTAYNVVPVVVETTGMKRIYISPSVMIEQITPRNGVKYTANISAGERIKTGNVTIRIAIADEYGDEYDWQEFSLPTQR